MMIELLHAKPFTVRYYEVGASRLVRPATLLDFLQDAAAEHASILRIGVQDLHHNAVYVGWALESTPEEVAQTRRPVDIEIGYRAEALAGDTVLARCAPEDGVGPGRFLHEIIREKDGKELVRLRVNWA